MSVYDEMKTFFKECIRGCNTPAEALITCIFFWSLQDSKSDNKPGRKQFYNERGRGWKLVDDEHRNEQRTERIIQGWMKLIIMNGIRQVLTRMSFTSHGDCRTRHFWTTDYKSWYIYIYILITPFTLSSPHETHQKNFLIHTKATNSYIDNLSTVPAPCLVAWM